MIVEGWQANRLSHYRLSVEVERRWIEPRFYTPIDHATGLADAKHFFTQRAASYVQDFNDALEIPGSTVMGALRHAVRAYGLPDVDFGDLGKKGSIWVGDLRQEHGVTSARGEDNEITFSGRLWILKGGTLPHHAFRFLLTQHLQLGGRRHREVSPSRCALVRDHAHEEVLLKSDVLRVTRRAVRDLLEVVSSDPTQLLAMEDRDVERLIATVAENLGFDVELTRSTKDGGRDLVLRCTDHAGHAKCYYVEVKHWVCGKRVGPRQLCDLLSVVARDGADGALVTSTSGFSVPAKQLVATPDVAALIRLIDLNEMISYIQEYAPGSTRSSPPIGLLAEIIAKPLSTRGGV
jgi:hypothetical protein